MHRGGLIVARNHDSRALVRLQVLDHGGDKLLMFRLGSSLRRLRPLPRQWREPIARCPRRAPADDDPPCRWCWSACSRWSRSATSFRADRDCACAAKARALDEEARKSAGEEVAVEGDDHIRLIQVVVGLHILPEGRLRAGANIVTVQRLVLHPLGLRIGLQDVVQFRSQAWASRRCG